MAKWNTFKWSDGTKWADGAGAPQAFMALVERSFYHLSLRITQVPPAGSTTAPTILAVSAEVGVRPQLPDQYEAFIDRNEETQRISVRMIQASNATTELTTEGGTIITTEGNDPLILDTIVPFTIDRVSILANRRSRRQPTG